MKHSSRAMRQMLRANNRIAILFVLRVLRRVGRACKRRGRAGAEMARRFDSLAVRVALTQQCKRDVGEARDVAGEHPDVVARAEKYLKGARTDSADWPVRPGKRPGGK